MAVKNLQRKNFKILWSNNNKLTINNSLKKSHHKKWSKWLKNIKNKMEEKSLHQKSFKIFGTNKNSIKLCQIPKKLKIT